MSQRRHARTPYRCFLARSLACCRSPTALTGRVVDGTAAHRLCVSCADVDVVERAGIIAQQGFWSPPGSSTFYKCANLDACLPGVNGTASTCAVGYAGVVCSVCDDAYFEQFGRCVPCPKDKGSSVAAMLGIAAALLVAAFVCFRIRNILPVGIIKLGVSMFQVVASGSTSYAIPW